MSEEQLQAAVAAPDLVEVKSKLQQLARDGRVDELIDLVIELLATVKGDNNNLKTQLKNALRHLYGRRSEKVSSSQLSLMFDKLDEVPKSAQEALDSSSNAEVPQPDHRPRAHKPRQGGRSRLPDNLPREEQTLLVTDEQRHCADCDCEKKSIGFLKSEVLEFVASHFKVIEQKREKVACPQCEAGVSIADCDKVMSRGRPGPALLAHIVVSKHADALPLYRQSQIYNRAGVHLSDSTLGDWCAYGIDSVRLIAGLILRHVLQSSYINLDDTPLKVQDRSEAKGIKKGRVWCLVGAFPYVAFRYAPNWKAEHAADFLEGYEGYTQGDGYAGYSSAIGPPGSGKTLIPHDKRLGCGMHIRRKFEVAAETGDARGGIALAYFRKIYHIERSCKADDLSFDARKARRDEQSRPLLVDLKQWVDKLHPSLTPGTHIYSATTYARNQWAYFERCFDDGRFEIDNGEAERQIRPLKIGERNYLFAGSENGAVDIAAARTIINTCKRAGVDPLAYLTDVIAKVQRGWPMAKLDELLPLQWQTARCAQTL